MEKSIFPFCYQVSAGALVKSGGNSSPDLTTNERPFRLRSIRATGNTGVTVSISSSDKTFMSAPVYTALIGSDANNGIPVFDEIIIPRKTKITFEFTNNDTASDHDDEYVQLWGEEL